MSRITGMMRSLAIVSVVLFAAAQVRAEEAKAPTGQKVTLKLNLKQGAKTNWLMSADQKIGMEIGGAKQDMNNQMSFGWTQEVQSVDDQGNANVKLTYTSVKFKIGAGPMVMEFDSAKEGDQQGMLGFLGAMVGQGFTCKVSPTGKVSDVKGAEEMFQKMAEKMPEGQREQMLQQMKGQLGEKMFEEMYGFYGDKPVDNGDSWTRTQKLPAPMEAEATTKYTLLEHGAGKAILGVDGTVESKEGAQMKLSGKQTGTMSVDESTGLPLKAEIKQDMKGEVQGIPMTILSTVTIETK